MNHEIDFLKSLTQAFNETVDTDRYQLHYIGGKAGPHRGIKHAMTAAKKLMADDPSKSSVEIHRINDDDTTQYVMSVTSGGHVVRPGEDEKQEVKKLHHLNKARAAAVYLDGTAIIVQPKNYSDLEAKNEPRFRLKFKKNEAFPTLDAVVRHTLSDYPDHKTLSFYANEEPVEPIEPKPEEPADDKPAGEHVKENAIPSSGKSNGSCPSCGGTDVSWYVEKPEIGGLTLKCNGCGTTYTKEFGTIYKPHKIVNENIVKPATFAKLTKMAVKKTGAGIVTLESQSGTIGDEFVENLAEAVALAQRCANENNTNVEIWIEPKLLGESQSLKAIDAKLFGIIKPALIRENDYFWTARSEGKKDLSGKISATTLTNAISSVKKAVGLKAKGKAKAKQDQAFKYDITFVGGTEKAKPHKLILTV